MVREVRIYIEGDPILKSGFTHFFRRGIPALRSRTVRLRLTLCGSGSRACYSFLQGISDHSDAFSLLLVDSEAPVDLPAWEHLRQRRIERCERLTEAHGSRCHLMIQAMEAWFFADVDALTSFYGSSFRVGTLALPGQGRVEAIPKDHLKSRLKRATEGITKGAYDKTAHAPKILALLDPETVRKNCSSCERLFATLHEAFEAPAS